MHAIDVVLSTYNWPRALELSLLSLTVQTHRDFGVIIADDGSAGETREVVERFRSRAPFPVTHVWQEDRGFRKSRILNEAVRRSVADQLVFSDGDCLFGPDTLEQHAQAYQPGGFAMGGYVRLDPEYSSGVMPDHVLAASFQEQMGPERRRQLRRIHWKNRLHVLVRTRRRPKMMGLNFSVDREAILALNGFDENYVGWGQEDSDLRNRLMLAGFTPTCLWHKAWVYHLHHAPNPEKRYRRNLAYYRRKNVRPRCRHGLVNETAELVPLLANGNNGHDSNTSRNGALVDAFRVSGP